MKWIKKSFAALAPHQQLGVGAEHKVKLLLRYHGIKCVHVGGFKIKQDLMVDGIRVEVKCASPLQSKKSQKAPNWFVNFHRHNKMSEGHVDYYIVRLVPVEIMGKRSIHLLFKSPVLTSTMNFTIHSLLSIHARNICAWDRFISEKKLPEFI